MLQNYVQDLQPQFRVLFMHLINNKVPKTIAQHVIQNVVVSLNFF
jgi:hypothetical protein